MCTLNLRNLPSSIENIRTYLRGLSIARCLSTAMAVRVKTLTFTLRTCTKGQKAHMKCGKLQRCRRAA